MAMVGYLNAPSPFDADGWFNTGDVVEQKGDYIRFMGRKSEIINVGGEKVFPAEIENFIQQLDNIKEVTVRGRPSPITGNIIVATVELVEPEDPDDLEERVRAACRRPVGAVQGPGDGRGRPRTRSAAIGLRGTFARRERPATRSHAARWKRWMMNEDSMTERPASRGDCQRREPGTGRGDRRRSARPGAIVATFSRSATPWIERTPGRRSRRPSRSIGRRSTAAISPASASSSAACCGATGGSTCW